MTSTDRRAALASLTMHELDALVAAAQAHARTLAKQVADADARAEAKGASQLGWGQGYSGQHRSTQEKRVMLGDLIAATNVVKPAATEAWIEYGERVVAKYRAEQHAA